MNREIKFRAWGKWRNEETLKMRYEEDGTPFYDSEGCFPDEIIEITSETHGWIWMQFTGLTDKRGKEIYEGDVVATFFSGGKKKGEVSNKDIVRWGTYNIGCNGFEYDFWVVGPYVKDEYLYGEMIDGEVYVIGNVYENPELLNSLTPDVL